MGKTTRPSRFFERSNEDIRYQKHLQQNTEHNIDKEIQHYKLKFISIITILKKKYENFNLLKLPSIVIAADLNSYTDLKIRKTRSLTKIGTVLLEYQSSPKTLPSTIWCWSWHFHVPFCKILWVVCHRFEKLCWEVAQNTTSRWDDGP